MSTSRAPYTPLELIDRDKEARDLLDKLERGHNLAMTAWATRRLASVIALTIDRRTSRGKTSAIVSESKSRSHQMHDLLALCEFGEGVFRPRTFSREEFLDALQSQAQSEQDWLDHLDLIYVPCVEDTLHRPFEWEHLCYRVQDRCRLRGLPVPQFILTISHRDLSEPALRRNFPIFDLNESYVSGHHSSHENAFGGNPIERIWWSFWAAEDPYLPALMSTAPDKDYGAEPVLAYYAGGRRIVPSEYVGDSETPMEDQLESLQHRLTDLRKQPWQQLMQGSQDGHFVRTHACSAEAIRDPAANPWRLLRTLAEQGGQALMANVVLPPTLLRSYLVNNAAYYADAPLEPLTPRMLNCINDVVAQLYLRLKREGARLSLEVVKQTLARGGVKLNADAHDTFSTFKKLVDDLFGAAVAARLIAHTTREWEQDPKSGVSGTFASQTWISLQSAIRAADVPWLDILSVEAEGISEAQTVRRDHVYQLFPPGQQVCMAGKLFRVKEVEHERVRVRKVAQPSVMTKVEREIVLHTGATRTPLEHQAPIKGANFTFHCEALELHFSIRNPSWWESEDFGKTWRNLQQEELAREYPKGRALRLVLTTPDGQALLTPAQRLALAQWLNEAAVTLLPESHAFMMAATHLMPSELPTHVVTRGVVPKLHWQTDTQECAPLDDQAVWIFEDSHADLGIIGACKDRAEWLLNLCLDHLTWLEQEANKAPATTPVLLNIERPSYQALTYGQESCDAAFDLSGLRNALSECGLINDRVSITKFRRQALQSGSKSPSSGEGILPGADGVSVGGADTHAQESGAIDGVACDFCGCTIDTQGHLLADGRHRCENCSAIAVDSIDEARRIFSQVLAQFPQVFGRALTVPIDVQFTTAAQIADAQGESYLPTSSFDERAIGLARMRGSKGNEEYSIFVEQGHSKESLSLTFSHELTHIWQYVWLDYERLRAEHGSVLIEGHASWAELFYARYRIQHAPTREERRAWESQLMALEKDRLSRNDEYGQGYRRFVEVVGVDGDAFAWIANLYAKSI